MGHLQALCGAKANEINFTLVAHLFGYVDIQVFFLMAENYSRQIEQ